MKRIVLHRKGGYDPAKGRVVDPTLERRCRRHPDRSAHWPSKVLCAECFERLDAKMLSIFRAADTKLRTDRD